MRLKAVMAIFVLWAASTAFASALTLTPKNLREHPNRFLTDVLKNNYKASDFYTKIGAVKIPSIRLFESLFKYETTHNPVIYRQGIINPLPGYEVPSIPFDVHTPSGTVPGCLNLICPPPFGAIWYAGICACG